MGDNEFLVEEYHQLQHEKRQMAERQEELEEAWEEAHGASVEQAQLIKKLERRLKELEKLADQRAEEAALAAELGEELQNAKHELKHTRSRLNTTSGELASVKEQLATRTEEEELLHDVVASQPTPKAKAPPEPAAPPVPVVPAAPAIDPALLARQQEELQRLKDQLEEEVERSARLERELRERRNTSVEGDTSVLSAQLDLAAELSFAQEMAAVQVEQSTEVVVAVPAEPPTQPVVAQAHDDDDDDDGLSHSLQGEDMVAMLEAERVALAADEAEAKEREEKDLAFARQLSMTERPNFAAEEDAYENERATLYTMFPTDDPSTIDAVIELRAGNVEAAIEDLLEMARVRDGKVRRQSPIGGSAQAVTVPATPPSHASVSPRRQGSMSDRKEQLLKQRSLQQQMPLTDPFRTHGTYRSANGSDSDDDYDFVGKKEKDTPPTPPPTRALLEGMVRVACPMCTAFMQAKPGTTVRCPACSHTFTVPGGPSDYQPFSPASQSHYAEMEPADASPRKANGRRLWRSSPREKKRPEDYGIILPSQEKIYEVVVVENELSRMLKVPFHGTGHANCLLKVTPAFVSLISSVSFQPFIEWTLPHIMHCKHGHNTVTLDAWFDGAQCPGELIMGSEQANAIFKYVRTVLNEYTNKRDTEMARDMQKEEMEAVLDLSDITDDFLRELRINEEFNRLLARETHTGFMDLRLVDNDEYRKKLKEMGNDGKKLVKTLKRKRRTKRSARTVPVQFDNTNFGSIAEGAGPVPHNTDLPLVMQPPPVAAAAAAAAPAEYVQPQRMSERDYDNLLEGRSTSPVYERIASTGHPSPLTSRRTASAWS